EHVSRRASRAARVPLRSPYPLRRRVHRRSAPWARRHEDPPAVCPIRGGNPRQRARPRSNRARRTPPSRSEAAQGPRRSSRSVLPDRGWRRKRSCRTETPDRKSASAPTHPRAQRAGGSIRQPAALSGVSGLKPTYGLVSRYGMIAFASSLDQGGPIAKSAEDLALLLNVMAGFDERDSTSVERAAEDYRRELDRPLAGLRVGVPKEHFGGGLAAEVGKAIEAALAQLEKLGAKRVPVNLPSSGLSVPA